MVRATKEGLLLFVVHVVGSPVTPPQKRNQSRHDRDHDRRQHDRRAESLAGEAEDQITQRGSQAYPGGCDTQRSPQSLEGRLTIT